LQDPSKIYPNWDLYLNICRLETLALTYLHTYITNSLSHFWHMPCFEKVVFSCRYFNAAPICTCIHTSGTNFCTYINYFSRKADFPKEVWKKFLTNILKKINFQLKKRAARESF
jgi:hypothetical protein